jgi:hypothetical protein
MLIIEKLLSSHDFTTPLFLYFILLCYAANYY